MSEEKEPSEKVKLEYYEIDTTSGMIRRNFMIELQSNKHDALKLKKEAEITLKKMRGE